MIASNIHHQMQKASFIEKLKDTEMSDTSSVVGSAVGLGDEENSNGRGNAGRRGSGDDSAIAAKDTNGGKSYGSTESSPWNMLTQRAIRKQRIWWRTDIYSNADNKRYLSFLQCWNV